MNNPEYCQRIYDAAKEVVERYDAQEQARFVGRVTPTIEASLASGMANLKRALEGKGG